MRKQKHISAYLSYIFRIWAILEGGETYIEPDLNIFKGTMALSPKYFSQATNTIVMTPANTND